MSWTYPLGEVVLSYGRGMLAGDPCKLYLYVWDASGGWQQLLQGEPLEAVVFEPKLCSGQFAALSGERIAVLDEDPITHEYDRAVYRWDYDQVYLESIIPPINTGFNWYVAIDGDTLVDGRRIFQFDSQTQSWDVSASLPVPPGAVGFPSRVVVDGDLVAISAVGDSSSSGKVFVYLRDPTDLVCPEDWCLWDELSASFPEVGDEFGAGLALDGDWLAVGAPGWLVEQGLVELFGRDASGHFTLRDTVATGEPDSRFGHSLALSGATLLVGAPLEAVDFPPPGQGHFYPDYGAAYLYRRLGDQLQLVETLVTSLQGPAETNLRLGTSVGASDAGALVGGPGASVDGDFIVDGAVFFYADRLPIHADGFESGDTSAWSSAVP